MLTAGLRASCEACIGEHTKHQGPPVSRVPCCVVLGSTAWHSSRVAASFVSSAWHCRVLAKMYVAWQVAFSGWQAFFFSGSSSLRPVRCGRVWRFFFVFAFRFSPLGLKGWGFLCRVGFWKTGHWLPFEFPPPPPGLPSITFLS